MRVSAYSRFTSSVGAPSFNRVSKYNPGMTYSGNATIIGFIGVSLLLLAFFLNLFKFLRAESSLYMGLNLVGAALAGYSSYLIDFLPFVLLEGTWATVAAIALVRKALGSAIKSRTPAP